MHDTTYDDDNYEINIYDNEIHEQTMIINFINKSCNV